VSKPWKRAGERTPIVPPTPPADAPKELVELPMVPLRDYFAAQAFTAAYRIVKDGHAAIGRTVAEVAYDLADAMMRAREIASPSPAPSPDQGGRPSVD